MRDADLLSEAFGGQQPPERDRFFEDFWRAAEAEQRRAARRWRRLAIVFAAVAVAATVSAGVFASSHTAATTIDQTWSCPVAALGGGPHLEVHTGVDTPGDTAYFRFTAMPQAQTGVIGPQQLSFFHRPSPIAFDPHRCRRVRTAVPLDGHGLVPGTTITTHFVGKVTATCPAARRVVFRVRASVKDGTPTRVLFAVRNESGRPVAFFDWSPARIASALAARCTTYPA
jgi:hypothetical protein